MAEPRGVVWPIILIVAGVVLLAHNLGYLEFAQLRELLATWWPAILIVVGLSQLARPRR